MPNVSLNSPTFGARKKILFSPIIKKFMVDPFSAIFDRFNRKKRKFNKK